MKEVICKVELGGGICVREFYSPVQELVRCKDCVFADKYAPGCSEGEYKCVSAESQGCDAYHDGSWFCADGKRE